MFDIAYSLWVLVEYPDDRYQDLQFDKCRHLMDVFLSDIKTLKAGFAAVCR